MNREADINFDYYIINEDGSIFSKAKNTYLSNNNIHPYVINEFVMKNGYNTTLSRHRVIWTYFNGEIPDGMQIDHINGDKKDNRLENLRCVTPYENTHNENTYENFLNAVRTEDFRKKMSMITSGRKMSEERYRKCEPTMFKMGHSTPKHVREKISNANSKPVVQLSLDNEFIAEWKSTIEAQRVSGFYSSSIGHCCNGGYFDKKRNKWVNIRQYKGYKWLWKTEYEKMLGETP